MDLILLKDVEKLGKAGEQVTVKGGFGRNYLLPRSLAVAATPGNVRLAQRRKKTQEVKEERKGEEAQKLARRLSSISVTIVKKAGPDDKLFGALTSADIASALEEEGIGVDRKDIQIPDTVKKLGVYTVDVRLHAGISGKLKVWVVKE